MLYLHILQALIKLNQFTYNVHFHCTINLLSFVVQHKKMKHLLLVAALFFMGKVVAQNLQFKNLCSQVYSAYPQMPKGVLEAVAFTQTRIQYLDGSEQVSCLGLPQAHGYLGLFEDGKNYFKANMLQVASLSQSTVAEIKMNRYKELESYTKAFLALFNQDSTNNFGLKIRNTLFKLSALPETGIVNEFARSSEVYEIMKWMNKADFASEYDFVVYQFSASEWFGIDNAGVLSSTKIQFLETGITGVNGQTYVPKKTKGTAETKSTEYGPAIWNPAPSCNFSSRNGTAISAITIHTIQGTYAGAISWSQNCSSSVSYHYVVRSSDGQITQMVIEANKAWHVGSENPYTIGYEHEGYVSQTGWYTTALYNASAALSRDICNSGYGINPLRTFYGAATTGTNTLGSCIRIKGHQHYPNQTHTDPGIYWDWELYYRLVNNAPTQTVLTTSTGSFYDTGGSGGSYANDERYFTLIQPSGATTVTLNFSAFNTEANWDYLYIYDGATNAAPLIGVYTGTNSPGTITSTGSSLLLEFRSDCATVSSGWAATWNSTVVQPAQPDITAPTTAISVPTTWITQNFTANFTDADNTGGSGLEKAFYQVIDYDGADWRANSQKGFFSDNFDLTAINADWTSAQGTWAISNGALVQSDEANANTNLYAFLNHGLSNRYLYHWAGAMNGTGTNRRAGLHYFCDDPTLPNRGNSYFVYFRLDNAKVQLYKVTNDVFTMVSEVSFTFVAGQWYDFKVAYDRITGKHQVYIDNSLVQSWVDTAPLASGNYFSLRSGNCVYQVNNMKVYRSRYPSVTVSVGATSDLRYQSVNPSTQAGRVKSIVQDSVGNLSSIISQDVLVDWTPPSDVVSINDGTSSDISTTTSTSTLEANWTSSTDQHSDVARYWYAIGTTPGGTNVVNWTDNFWNTSVSVSGLSLTLGTTYYVSVKVENGAGLISNVTSSNGQQVVAPTNPPVANFIAQNTYVCVTDSMMLTNTSIDATSFAWTATGALNPTSNAVNPYFQFPVTGTYTVQLIAYGPNTSDTTSQAIYVQVSPLNSALFTVSNDTLYVPNTTLTCTNNSTNANGYAWTFGDGTSSTDTNPWHTYSGSGTYIVQLIAVNDACPQDTTTQTILVINNLGLGENALSTITLYPNPVEDILQVDFSEVGGFVQIYDVAGRLVLEQQLKTSTMQVIVKDWAAGTYLLNFSSVDKQESVQFVKR